MPRRDGTGPNGMGPMTGRRAGLCAGFTRPGYVNAGGYCGGFGHGRGFRKMWDEPGFRGCGYDYDSAYPAGEESNLDKIKILKLQENQLEMQLEQIKKRLESFEPRDQ